MNDLLEQVSKYKNYIIAGCIILLIAVLMIGNYRGSKTSEKLKSKQERKELIGDKAIKCLTDENTIITGLTLIKYLDKAEKKDISTLQIDLHFNFIYKEYENNGLIAILPEIKIPNPAINTIKDEKYGYPVALSYQFNIDNNDSIIRKRLKVRYSLDTVVEFDFYTPLINSFFNEELALKKIAAYDKDQELYIEKLKREQVNESKQREREVKLREQKPEQSSKPRLSNDFTFRSTFYDIEKTDGSVETVNEVTLHKFDLTNMVVTQASKLNGQRLNFKYKIKSYYTEAGINTNYVFVINSQGVNEIWLNFETPNMGYDYIDGTRIAIYGLTRVE